MIEELEYPTYTSKFPELGFYAFPGATYDTRSALDQVTYADQLGIGNVMVSERPDYKEAGTLCGAVAAVTENIHIGTSAINPNTRHPNYVAALASSINRMSRGRFALGLGKGTNSLMQAWGLKPNTYAREKEYVELYRRLLKGETIVGYSGEIGDYGRLGLFGEYVNEDVPILFIGFGPKSLQNAGTLYDGVHLHTFIDPESLTRAVGLIREGERQARRPSGSTRIWSVLATLCNVSEEEYLKGVVGRLATYMQIPGYGEGLIKINNWDQEAVEAFRRSKAVMDVNGLIDAVATLPQLEKIDKELPQEWRSAAIGSPRECAERWVKEFEAGADGLIIHHSSPREFEPVLREYEKIRPGHLFAGYTNRPA